ncbi:transmembrane protein 127-like [Acipenser oxyrinchus oxyrinchus]|uniref:Transmembrane protein 127-like n=1 Tax=Acipenser oxyrinchus oxyrinchus TaxID=40147 RepID=A0AAD8CG61_ACIOX|nr:transmembrane protein 127-like [Acipenser oxyrinchus oxyrinchus]
MSLTETRWGHCRRLEFTSSSSWPLSATLESSSPAGFPLRLPGGSKKWPRMVCMLHATTAVLCVCVVFLSGAVFKVISDNLEQKGDLLRRVWGEFLHRCARPDLLLPGVLLEP